MHRVPVPLAALVALGVGLPAASLGAASGRPGELLGFLVLLPLLITGALVAARRPALVLGWQLLAAGVGAVVADALGSLVLHGVVTGATAAWAVTLSWPGWVASAPGLLGLALLRVPTGALPSPRWRVAEAAGLLGLVLVLVAGLFGRWPATGPAAGLDNPLALDGVADLLAAVFAPGYLLVVVATVLGALSLLVRWRRGDPQVREQLTWVVAAAVVAGIALAVAGVLQLVAPLPVPLVDLVPAPVLGLLPTALGAAVLRRGALDVHVALSRTLVYAPLAAGVVLVGVLPVVVLARVLPPGYGTVPAVVAATLVAAALEPARARLQRAARRMVYGGAEEPFAVVRDLGDRLSLTDDAGDVADGLLALLVEDLRLPYVDVAVDGAAPRRSGPLLPVTHEVVLQHGEHRYGVVRAGGARLDPGTARLVAHVAQTSALTLAALKATDELRAARAATAAVREEERRRLRRDLHDGLGPALTGVSFTLQALRNRLVSADVLEGQDEELLRVATEQVAQSVEGLRRAVHDLRPATLDEVGLTEALRRQGAVLAAGSGLDIDVRGLPPDTDLPAAVEVVAYRVAVEGLTNALRHAHARSVGVDLALDGDVLVVTVADDGRGGADVRRSGGVGLRTVHERVGELGGRAHVESRPGRTVLRAALPVKQS